MQIIDQHCVVQDYAIIAILTFSGVYFTNLSLNYINYASRIIVKSCKVLPVMLIRVLIQSKRHTLLEYCAALLLVSGISLFTLGDRDGYPEFSLIGIMLIGLALVRLISCHNDAISYPEIKPTTDLCRVSAITSL